MKKIVYVFVLIIFVFVGLVFVLNITYGMRYKDIQRPFSNSNPNEYTVKLKAGMSAYWSANFSDQESFQTYQTEVAKVTDNLSPEKCAAFLFPNKSEGEKFLKDLKLTKEVQKTDINEIYQPWYKELFDSSEQRAMRKYKRSLFISIIAGYVTPKSNDNIELPTLYTEKTIEKELNEINKSTSDPNEKLRMIFHLLYEKYNFGYTDLHDLGFIK